MPISPINPSGVFTAFLYPTQVGQGPGISGALSADPGSVNPPIFFEPPPLLSACQLLLWIIVTGSSPNWGGARIWASVDNQTYTAIGTVLQGGVQGVLTATFPTGSDPDTANTLSVDLSESHGQLLAGTTTDADDYLTLCYCDGELIAYSAATLTGPSQYSMDTYIRRGAYGSAIGSHASGTQFGRFLATTFSQVYPVNLVGKTIYFKFTSFNAFGGGAQDLSAVQAYSYTLTGAGLCPNTLAIRRIPQGSTYTLAATDYRIEVVSGSLAPTTINGPTGTLNSGKRYEIHDKNNNCGTYPINFVPASPQTIEGQTSYAETISNGTLVVTWDSVEWSGESWSD